MFNISKNTKITGYEGSVGSLQAALNDRNLHASPSFTYFGKRVQRGSVDVLIRGAWTRFRFDAENGWLRSLEVV